MRYYFHLMGEDTLIWDSVGVEVAQFAPMEVAAIEIIQEFRREESGREQEFTNWKLAVTDSDGTIVVLLPLFAFN